MGTSYACLGAVRNLENVGKRMGADLLLNFLELRHCEVRSFELGEDGWLKALELDEYAARSQNGPESIQGVLFSYLEALQPALPEYGALV
jgi:hypothetical protein